MEWMPQQPIYEARKTKVGMLLYLSPPTITLVSTKTLFDKLNKIILVLGTSCFLTLPIRLLLTSMLSTGYFTYYSLPIRIRRVWHYPFPWLQTHPL